MSEAAPHTAAVQEPTVSVRSLWIPLQGMELLLPNTAVAEISDYEPPHPLDGAPAWLLGTISWRGRSVPLVSFERLVGAQMEERRGMRVAVVNTLNHHPQLPFIGLLARGIPRLQQLRDGMLEVQPFEDDDAVVKLRVALEDEQALIPDLDVLERMLLKHGVGGS